MHWTRRGDCLIADTVREGGHDRHYVTLDRQRGVSADWQGRWLQLRPWGWGFGASRVVIVTEEVRWWAHAVRALQGVRDGETYQRSLDLVVSPGQTGPVTKGGVYRVEIDDDLVEALARDAERCAALAAWVPGLLVDLSPKDASPSLTESLARARPEA